MMFYIYASICAEVAMELLLTDIMSEALYQGEDENTHLDLRWFGSLLFDVKFTLFRTKSLAF